LVLIFIKWLFSLGIYFSYLSLRVQQIRENQNLWKNLNFLT
jgi:hypothetical protein